jgi:hypothetical protein
MNGDPGGDQLGLAGGEREGCVEAGTEVESRRPRCGVLRELAAHALIENLYIDRLHEIELLRLIDAPECVTRDR